MIRRLYENTSHANRIDPDNWGDVSCLGRTEVFLNVRGDNIENTKLPRSSPSFKKRIEQLDQP